MSNVCQNSVQYSNCTIDLIDTFNATTQGSDQTRGIGQHRVFSLLLFTYAGDGGDPLTEGVGGIG